MMRVTRWLAAAVALFLFASGQVAARESDADTEAKLGVEAAAEADKTLKFVTDEKYLQRVKTIGDEIAGIAKVARVRATYGSANLVDFTYTFKVVDEKEANAFSLPAGYIYVNKGLIDRVESDDELAGVLAHEIAHVAHHHMLHLLRKQSKFDAGIFAIIAAAALGKVRGSDMQNIFYGAKLFEIARLNSYSQEAEDDADATAIQYMLKTKYNPVGILTFMEKLARDQAYDPIDPGIFRTHPPSRERANKIIAQLKRNGVAINRRAVASGIKASVRDATVNNTRVSEVVVAGKVIFQPADIPGDPSAERAREIAKALNAQLETDPQPWEVKTAHDGTAVYVRQQLIVDVRQADAELVGSSREALAVKVKDSIQVALLSERLKLMY